MDGLISASQAAALIGCSKEVLVRKIQRGDLPGRLVAGRWLAEGGYIFALARERRAAANRDAEPQPAA